MSKFFSRLFVFFFLAFSVPSFAANGYGYQGICQASADDAFQAFVASFPKIESGYFYELVSAQINATTIWYQLNSINMTSQKKTVLPVQSVQLYPCTGAMDYVLIGQIWGFFFAGTLFLFLVAFYAGEIYKAVRSPGSP